VLKTEGGTFTYIEEEIECKENVLVFLVKMGFYLEFGGPKIELYRITLFEVKFNR
jgi:hypothetical protein